MKSTSIFTVLLLSTLVVWSQESSFPEMTDDVAVNRYRLHQYVQENLNEQITDEEVASAPGKKSVGKAVVMSAVLPGAGQVYAKSFLKGLLFFAAEATAWTINIAYNQKGDDKTREHRQFVDEHWSEQRYWSYVYYRLQNVEGLDLPSFTLDTSDPNKPIIINWQEAEQILDQYDESQYLTGFTHQLPATKTQQYYEMVGKYPVQFGNAWDDASFTEQYDGYAGKITPHNDQAETLRAELNHLYNIAGYGSMIALVNHLVSALDAGFTTRSYNRRHMQLTYDRRYVNGERVNMFGVRMYW